MLAGIKTGKKKKEKKQETASIATLHSLKRERNNAIVADNLRRTLEQQLPSNYASLCPGVGDHQQHNQKQQQQQPQQHRSLQQSDFGFVGHSFFSKNQDRGTSLTCMLAEVKTSTYSLAEQEAFEILRQKKRAKRSRADDQQGDICVDAEHVYVGEALDSKSSRRYENRHVNKLQREVEVFSKCWWWIRSSSFDSHRLLAASQHVSLLMAPSSKSLVPSQHLYLVPIPHVESLASADAHVWQGIQNFQLSLTKMYRSIGGKCVVYWETVMPSQRVWQTKLECVVIPSRFEPDISLYFKSALLQQVSDLGIHQKLIHIDTTQPMPLKGAIPSNNKFPYFFVKVNERAGIVQLIEDKSFPPDFGMDTIAGMMKMDPLRLRRRTLPTKPQEQQQKQEWLEQWKQYDWTLQLRPKKSNPSMEKCMPS